MTVVVKTTDGEENAHFGAEEVDFPLENEVPPRASVTKRMRVMKEEEVIRTYLTSNVIWYE